MTVAFVQSAISSRLLLMIPIGVAVGMVLLTRAMRHLALRPQFMVLLILGVSIGFIFFVIAQMPEFPQWLGVTLVVIVFIASLFGTRIFCAASRRMKRMKTKRFALKTLAKSTILSFHT